MDNGTRITPEVEAFLKAVQAKEVEKVSGLLKADNKLLNSIDAGGNTAAHFAASSGDLQMLELLISSKAELTQPNYDDNTALVAAVKGTQIGAIRSLIAAGVDVNRKAKSGATALHHAASTGDVDTFDLLVSLGAKVDVTPCECGTPLHWAAGHEDPKMAGWLMFNHNIDVNAKDVNGGTPLFVALHTKHSNVIKFLLEYGADATVTIPQDGTTCLHVAVEYATTADVKALITFGANGAVKDKAGKSALDLATEKGQKEMAKELAKPLVDAAKKETEAARFKAQGNKVFGEGESVKAAKFYTLAIGLQPSNHVFFSNRSASYFNTKNYLGGYFDACRCISISPSFVRGYFRKAACLKALQRKEDALAVIAAGLKLEAKNSDLITLRDEIKKQKV